MQWPPATNTSEPNHGSSIDSTRALPSQSSSKLVTDRKDFVPRPQPNLYEFFMNFLDQFYARPFLIKDGLECLFLEKRYARHLLDIGHNRVFRRRDRLRPLL